MLVKKSNIVTNIENKHGTYLLNLPVTSNNHYICLWANSLHLNCLYLLSRGKPQIMLVFLLIRNIT